VLTLAEFDYRLPPECVATRPAQERDAARLMTLRREGGPPSHRSFRNLPALLSPRSVLVLNDTRVFPARLRGTKPSGGVVEVLLTRAVDGGEVWEALGRGLARLAPGASLAFGGGLCAEVVERRERGEVRLRFAGRSEAEVRRLLESVGEVPLPPYIEAARRRTAAAGGLAAGQAFPEDRQRYQTVYARVPGAVAAPTAGLHFTAELLARLTAAGHQIVYLTLDVGPGTFRPVESADPTRHEMDPERYRVPEATASAVNRARAEGRPIVAVGTTVVRALESAVAPDDDGGVRAGAGETRLYILPGAAFRVITDLVTNFHMPRSTLLMLVAAFAGRGRILDAYAEAVARGYRFGSYGDAMLIGGGGGGDGGAAPPEGTAA